MNTLTRLLTIALLLCASGSLWAQGLVDYTYPDLKEVRDFRKASINGWSQINDQVLLVSAGASRQYLLVLSRPDRDLTYSHALGFTDSNGRVSAKFDKVYATNNHTMMPNPIKRIYEVKGKEQAKAARQWTLEQACAQQSDESRACKKLHKQ